MLCSQIFLMYIYIIAGRSSNIQSSRLTSGPRFIWPVTVWKIKHFSLCDGPTVEEIQSFGPVNQDGGEQGQVYQPG